MPVIQNDQQHAEAVREIEEIFWAKAGTPESKRLEALVDAVVTYEKERWKF